MAQLLETLVVLSGRTDSSFTNLGNNILALGNRVNGVSEQIIRFGKEATKEFVEYDDVMREIRALGGYDQSTMDTLHEINRTIAQTSRYTMDQAAEAEVLMAQLGLGMKDIQTLLPSVMNMATAGNMQMGDSLGYLYYTLRALDMPLSDAGLLADQMAKTAAISAADIDTLGLSLQRLGSGSQFFAGGSSELLAILGAISQFGEDMQGASAGTQLRNFMLTLLAPTMSKEKLMQEMGMTEEAWGEFEQYMDDAGINVTDTAQAMDTLGLSMYDARTGELKPMIQILGELDASLAGMEESEKNALLGQLFGKRTTITALNLISSLGTIIDMQKQIEDSEGFTLGMSEIMEGGPGGAIRELTASWDMLKTTVGEVLGPDVQKGAEFLTGMVNGIANMDPAAMKGIAASMTALAAAGPGMMLVGTAFKLLGFLGTPFGAVLLGSLAAIGIGKFLSEKDAERFKSQFGDMSLDVEALTSHMEGLRDVFREQRSEFDQHIDVLEEAAQAYEDTSVSFSQNLLTAAISGRELTEADKQNIMTFASKLHEEFMLALGASFDAKSSYMSMLFGGDEEAMKDPAFRQGMMMLGSVYNVLSENAARLGGDIGNMIGTAMDDGIITGNEYAAIMEKVQLYNEYMGVFQEGQRNSARAQQLHQAQNVNWDSASTFLSDNWTATNQLLSDEEMMYIGQRAEMSTWFDFAIENGMLNPATGYYYTEGDKQDFFNAYDAQYLQRVSDIKGTNTDVVLATVDALMRNSKFGDAWSFMGILAESGQLPVDENGNIQWKETDWEALDWAHMLPEGRLADGSELEGNVLALNDDKGRFVKLLKPYADLPEVAALLNMFEVLPEIAGSMGAVDVDDAQLAFNPYVGLYGNPLYLAKLDEFRGKYYSVDDEFPKQTEWLEHMSDDERKIITGLNELYDTDAVLEWMGIDMDANHPMREPLAALQLAYWNYDPDNLLIPKFFKRDEPPELPATVDSEGLANVAGSAGSEAKTALMDGWGSPVLVADVEIRKPGQVNNPNLLTMSAYAEGGRATEASIFGEAGPEWAIPEEHTDRVAALLNSARQAAGFTWGELIGRNGGLNAGGHEPVSIVYAPVIYANDATGVEEKLKEDKLRLENWLEERRMRDEVEVFA